MKISIYFFKFLNLIGILFLYRCTSHSNSSPEENENKSQSHVPHDSIVNTNSQQDTSLTQIDSNSVYLHDTIRILSFFGHELSDLPKLQDYWMVIKTDDGKFKREKTQLEKISTSPYPNQYILNSFGDKSVNFIYTGLNSCTREFKADDRIKKMQEGDSIIVQQNNMSTAYFLYSSKLLTLHKYYNSAFAGKKTLFNFKDILEDNQYFSGINIKWIGDIDCDNINEIIIDFEIGNTIYNYMFKSQSDLDYCLISSESLYWD